MAASTASTPRLTRAAAAKQPKVTAAVAFLLSAPLDEDDSEADESFDPTEDDSFFSDDEPDAVITREEVDLDALQAKMCCSIKRAQPTPLEPAEQEAYERRAAELGRAYEAALVAAAGRSTPPVSRSSSSSTSDDDSEMATVEDEPTVEDVTHKVDSLALASSP